MGNLKDEFVTDDNTGGFFVCECQDCGLVFNSKNADGGGQIADTGDYDDSYCPECGCADIPECENANNVWNVQQEKINRLENKLESLRAQLNSAQQPPAVAVPEQLIYACTDPDDETPMQAYARGWNECRSTMLAAAPSRSQKSAAVVPHWAAENNCELTALYAAPVPADHIPGGGKKVDGTPAAAVPDSFKKVIFEQPDESKELVIGVDDNDCPYFILGTQKFRLDPTVIENRDDAKWYQKQLSIAFEKFTTDAHIKPSPRITEQDAREILEAYWNSSDDCGDWLKSDDGRAILDKLNAGRPDHIAEAGKMMRIGLDQPWSMRSCVKKLIDAAEILLDQKNYDGHGHEEIRAAQVAAQKYIDHSVDANKKVCQTVIAQTAPHWVVIDDPEDCPAGEDIILWDGCEIHIDHTDTEVEYGTTYFVNGTEPTHYLAGLLPPKDGGAQ